MSTHSPEEPVVIDARDPSAGEPARTAADETPSSPSTGGFWAVVAREWHRVRVRGLYLLLLLVFPVGAWAILASTFSERMPRDLPVAIVDADGSALSRQIGRYIDASPTMNVAAYAMSPAEGEALLREGKAYAVIVLESGLERAVMRGESPRVVAFYNGQWLLPGNLIAKDLRQVFGTLSAGINVKRRMGAGEAYSKAMVSAEPIRFDMRALHNPEMDYTAFLLPSLLATLLQIFVVLIAVHTTGTELKHGTATQWLDTAGGSTLKAVAGKFLPYTLWFSALGVAMFVATYVGLGVPFRGTPGVFAAGIVLLVLCYQAIGLFLVAFTANLRLATSMASFIAGPAFAFSGVSFPVMAMPAVAKAWALALPLTHFIAIIIQQGVAGAPAYSSQGALYTMIGVAVILPLLAIPRLSVVLRNARYWGGV